MTAMDSDANSSDNTLDYAANDRREPPKGAMMTIFFVALVDMLGFGLVIPLLPFYAREFNASPPQVTMLFAIFSICQFVAAPILGGWSDRIGRRPILIFSLAGNVSGYLLLAWATQHHWTNLAMGLYTVYLSRVIAGLTSGNISAAQAYVSDITTPANRTRGMGVLGAAFGIGFSIGPAAGGILAHAVNNSAPAWLAAGLGLLAVLLCATRLKEAPVHRPSVGANYFNLQQYFPLFANKGLMKVNASWFIAMSAFVAVDSSIVMFLADTFKFDSKGVAYYFLVVGLVIIITQGGLVGRLSRRYGEWSLCISGIAINGVGSMVTALTAWYPSVWILMSAAAIYAFGRSLFQPTISALVSHHSDPKQQGLSYGFFQAVGTLARIVGPITAGYLYVYHHTSPWLIGATVLWLTSVGLWHLHRRESAHRVAGGESNDASPAS